MIVYVDSLPRTTHIILFMKLILDAYNIAILCRYIWTFFLIGPQQSWPLNAELWDTPRSSDIPSFAEMTHTQ